MQHDIDFLNHLESEGYKLVNKSIVADKTNPWERLFYGDEKQSSCRYVFHILEKGALGVYGGEKSMHDFETWKSWEHGENTLSAEEVKKLEKEYKRKKKEIEAQENKAQEDVRDRIGVDILMMDKAEIHPYATRKKIKPRGAYLNDKALFIPIYQSDGEIWSGQNIYPDGTKIFESGGRIKGGFFPISGDSDAVYVCEGYSTGRSINEATGKRVYVSFNSGNLHAVALYARQLYPKARLIIAADNDRFTIIKGNQVNVGRIAAEKIARAIECEIKLPDFGDDINGKPTDWNDFSVKYGQEETKKVLLEQLFVGVVEGDETVMVDSPSIYLQEHKSQIPDNLQHTVVDADNWENFIMWKNEKHGIFDDKFSLHNAILFVTYNPKWRGTFVFDDFQKVERIIKPTPWDDKENFKWRSLLDNDLTQMRATLSYMGIKLGGNKEMRDVISVAAEKCKVHPVQDHFDSLEWDRIPRLDNWLIDYCKCEDQDADYLRAVAACTLKASVKRIFNAGEGFHHMPVLEGLQAAGKSSLWRSLATFYGHSYFTDHLSFADIDNPHMAAHLVGNIFVEFQEMTGSTSKDRNRIKAWLTMPTDKIQPKFKNEIVEYPRQFVPVGTTNDGAWLNDPTGGRRFWPIKVGKIDVEGIDKIKEQLWAEAVHRVKVNNELHYILETDPIYRKAQEEQSARYIGHAWEDVIAKWLRYDADSNDLTMDNILSNCLFIPKERWNHSNRNDVSDVMRSMGYESKSVYDSALKKSVRKWVKK